MRFDNEGKIKSIRQNWDQGCLLKQVDVIGRSGRNWPIRDSNDQIKMITKLEGKATDDQDAVSRVRSASNNAMRDPHASLSLFANREDLDAPPPGTVVSPKKAGSRPRQRSFTEILGDEPTEGTIPVRRDRSPAKAGAGKNFAPNRLFEAQEVEEADTPPKSKHKTDPKKYRHFDFADGSDPQDKPKPGAPLDRRPKTKHDSSWDFEDFVTPQKAPPTRGLGRRQDLVHWSTVQDELQETPASKPAVQRPRRDNETHFQFVDDGESHGEPRLLSRRGEVHNDSLGLYKNNLYEENEEVMEQGGPRALGNITNIKDRRKDFEPHFAMTDDSPRASTTRQGSKVPDDRKKAVKMMDANWEAYDESPKQKENFFGESRGNGERKLAPEDGGRVYQVAGDGMGSRKGARGWSIGDSDEEVTPKPPRRQNLQHQSNFSWNF